MSSSLSTLLEQEPPQSLKTEIVQVTVLNKDIYREKVISYFKALIEEEKALLKEGSIPAPYNYGEMDLEYQYESYLNNMYVYCLGEEVVGVVTLHTESKSLSNLYIVEEHRGKGYGTELAKFLIDNADVDSLTIVPNNPAKRIYEKLGFETSLHWMILPK